MTRVAGPRARIARSVTVLVLVSSGILTVAQSPVRAAPTEGRSDAYVTRTTARLTDRLGASNRGVEPRVVVSVTATAACVRWALDRPDAPDDTKVVDREIRAAELRRELRRVLRTLAALPPPETIQTVSVRATYRDAGASEATLGIRNELSVLDASLSAGTVVELEADDVRLDDATLEELLGLASAAVGDPTWGVPAVPHVLGDGAWDPNHSPCGSTDGADAVEGSRWTAVQ